MFRLLLLLSPVYATLFWAVVLNTVKPYGNAPKTFLGKFFVVSCLTFIAHLLYFIPFPRAYLYADSIYYLTHLLVFPLYYIYVRLLAIDRRFSLHKHYKYLLVPFVLFLLYTFGSVFMTKKEYLHFIFDTLPETKAASGIFLYQKVVYSLVRIAFVIQGIVYMTRSILDVNRNQKNVDNYYSNTEDDSLKKVQWLNITVSVTMTTSVIMEMLGKERFAENDYLLLAPSLFFTAMLFCIGWLGNRQRAVLLTIIEEEKEVEMADNENNKFVATKQRQIHLKNRLRKLFVDEHIFLNKDLTIWELAKKLGTNRTYLSQIINTEYGQNFSTFVNTYRAYHADLLQKTHPELSQLEIADLSGFGSIKSWKRVKQCNNKHIFSNFA